MKRDLKSAELLALKMELFNIRQILNRNSQSVLFNPKSKRYEIYKKKDLSILRAIMRGESVQIAGGNVDEDDATMNAFLQKTAVSFPSVRDAAQSLVAAANVSTMPTSFIIDRQGIIRHVHNGFHKKDAATVLAQIQALL
jgi:alkyl hydroperoxide reductase subunit AhpC